MQTSSCCRTLYSFLFLLKNIMRYYFHIIYITYISTEHSIVRNELQLTNWQFCRQLLSLIITNLIICLTVDLRVIVTTIAFQILFRYDNLTILLINVIAEDFTYTSIKEKNNCVVYKLQITFILTMR